MFQLQKGPDVERCCQLSVGAGPQNHQDDTSSVHDTLTELDTCRAQLQQSVHFTYLLQLSVSRPRCCVISQVLQSL